MTTAAEAPALTPSRPGSASGLRVSACMSAPASAERDADEEPEHRSAAGARRATTVALSVDVRAEQRVDDLAERDLPGADGQAEQDASPSTRQGGEQARAPPDPPRAGGRRRRGGDDRDGPRADPEVSQALGEPNGLGWP